MRLTYEEIERIAKKFGTPYQIYDKTMIVDHVRNFLSTFRKTIPKFQNFFAVKALPNPEILKILYEQGCKFDCSSLSELYICKQIVKNENEIMYTSNYTSIEDLETVIESNCIINLDDIDGLDNLVTACRRKNLEIPKMICFRLNPAIGNTSSETKSNILGGSESKFGMSEERLMKAYQTAKIVGISKFGLHTMIGSCVLDVNHWKDLIEKLYITVDRLYDEANIKLEFINLGGGIGIPYRPDQQPINLEQLVDVIHSSITQCIKKYNLPYHPNIYMENGRYITGQFGWLVAKCCSIKQDFETTFYGLDACMANLMRCGMYGAYHHITIPRLDDANGSQIVASIVGSLCEGNDQFCKDRKLPDGIRKNDLFVIHDTGAHGHAMGFQYNGKLRCPELLIEDDKSIRMIRRRETFDDLFGTCIST